MSRSHTEETPANHGNEREAYLTIQCGVFDRSFMGVNSRASELRGPLFFCVAGGGAIASRVVVRQPTAPSLTISEIRGADCSECTFPKSRPCRRRAHRPSGGGNRRALSPAAAESTRVSDPRPG